jgi:hypothetical protein
MMKNLLVAGALGEAAFGVFVFLAPGLGLALLFGAEPVAGAVIMTRVAGIALVGLGIACYPAGPRQRLYGLLTYSILVMLYLIAVGIGGSAGILLWPAVAVHAVLSGLLIVAARKPDAS